jgi:hypothetical protein
MIHRPYEDILTLHIGDEMALLDELNVEMKYYIIVYMEELGPRTAFAYLQSYDDKENTNTDIGMPYAKIAVFDDLPNEVNGIYRDPIIGQYGKYTGDK